jgi:hypothetical protein
MNSEISSDQAAGPPAASGAKELNFSPVIDPAGSTVSTGRRKRTRDIDRSFRLVNRNDGGLQSGH